jgi:hypothetical protein
MSEKTIIETHGKVESTVPTMLEQIWGYNELAKYGTKDEEVYRNQISDMNRTDLEAHARRVGVVIVESTGRLRENLLKEFRIYFNNLSHPAPLPKAQPNITAEVQRILNEGK